MFCIRNETSELEWLGWQAFAYLYLCGGCNWLGGMSGADNGQKASRVRGDVPTVDL